MQTFNLDLSAKRVIPLLYVKQRDVGTKIQIKLTDNKKEYTIPDGVTWSVWYSGKSGEGNYTKVGDRNAVEVDGSTATVELIYQMLDNPGEHAMCLVMNGADCTQLGLWNIPYFVEAIPGADSKAATAYYQAFLDAQAKAEEAAGRAKAAAGQIVVDQEFIETQVFSVGQASEIAAAAARDAAQSEKNTKDDADRAAGAADDAAAALARTEEVADSVGSPVSYKPQTLPEKEKAQAKENIGASTFYHTEREELGVAHEDINTEYIYGLYDALMAQYPDNVQKTKVHNDDDTFTNYEYVISTGDYSKGAYVLRDGSDGIKKPKYLVMSGIDGNERKTVFSTYRFVRDILRGHNVPQSFKEGVVLHILPVGSPWGFDNFERFNENGVYIERNFDCEWASTTPTGVNPGASVASEKETQAITKWLNDNADADLFISFHNSGGLNEIAVILGDSTNDTTDLAKKIALQGVARVIPFWKDVIGYPLVFKDVQYLKYDEDTGEWSMPIGDRNTIFSYSAALRSAGSSVLYAQEKLSIPSFVIETPAYYGTYQEWLDNETVYQPEPISAGAEVLGNILLEFYEQSFLGEVNGDMKKANGKLDAILLGISYRTESGTVVIEEDLLPEEGKTSFSYKIPCSAGAKTLQFYADSETLNAIKATSGTAYLTSLLGNGFAPMVASHSGDTGSLVFQMTYVPELAAYNNGWLVNNAITSLDTTDGASFKALALKAGTYHWKAYYWDE